MHNYTQHTFPPPRWPPVPRLRIVWLNQRAQLAPRDNLFHLFQKLLSSCLFCVPLKTIHRRQSPLLFVCRSHLAAPYSIFLWKGRSSSESHSCCIGCTL